MTGPAVLFQAFQGAGEPMPVAAGLRVLRVDAAAIHQWARLSCAHFINQFLSTSEFPIQKRDILCKIKEIEGFRGDVHWVLRTRNPED